MAVLTVQKMTMGLSAGTYSGTTPTYGACAAGGDTFVAGDVTRTFLHLKNTSGGALTVTIDNPTSRKCNLGHEHDIAVSVPLTTGDKMIPIDVNCVDPSSGIVTLSYSGVTNLTIAVLEIGVPPRG